MVLAVPSTQTNRSLISHDQLLQLEAERLLKQCAHSHACKNDLSFVYNPPPQGSCIYNISSVSQLTLLAIINYYIFYVWHVCFSFPHDKQCYGGLCLGRRRFVNEDEIDSLHLLDGH
jgi:hypothetical protein